MAKTKKREVPGSPLPAHFHPKDTPEGMIGRNPMTLGVWPDCSRHTVLIAVCGSTIEMTAAAAQSFADRINSAIDCTKDRLSQGKDGGR